ncbi:MAG: FecR domain-containing protein [Muribaculaceae bacterium]|nr:FecR domain-containing protein [Muribaculaceae bacterium]
MKNLKATYIEKVLGMFASGRYSASTRARVSRWLVNGEDSELKDDALDRLWEDTVRETSAAEPDEDCDAARAFARWQARMAAPAAAPQSAVGESSAPSVKTKNVRILRLWQSVAACLVIALGALSWVTVNRRPARSSMTQVYCSAGRTKAVTLPDGSVVTLNGGSSVTYPASFDGYDRREVLLMGEACFKVAKDRKHPFVVRGGEMDITALGTEFNVKAYPETSTTHATLLEGSVRVQAGEDASGIVLQPSEQISFNRRTGEVERSLARPDDVTAWQRGEIVFNNLTLPEILAELNNRFSHRFVYNAAQLPDDRFTFRFRKGMTINDVMAIVSDVAGNITVSIDDDTCKVRLKS